MIIEIQDYRLIQEETTFNLIWISKAEETIISEIEGKRTRTKTGKLIDKEVEMGYNMSLDRCIHKIIMNNLYTQQLQVDFLKWIEMYREERKKITDLLNNLTENKNDI